MQSWICRRWQQNNKIKYLSRNKVIKKFNEDLEKRFCNTQSATSLSTSVSESFLRTINWNWYVNNVKKRY